MKATRMGIYLTVLHFDHFSEITSLDICVNMSSLLACLLLLFALKPLHTFSGHHLFFQGLAVGG